MEEEKKEYLFKVLVIGDIGVGKTSIIQQYVHGKYSQYYRATIGVDFALKVLKWNDDTLIRLQLWDVAGQERFGTMTRVYYREAVGAFVVFDITKQSTFEGVNKWKTDLDTKVTLPNGREIPAVLLGNKCDLKTEGTGIDDERIKACWKEKRFANYYETSAKTSKNIEEAATFLVKKMLTNDHFYSIKEEKVDSLNLTDTTVETQSKCCN